MRRVLRLGVGMLAFVLLAPMALFIVPQLGGGEVAYTVLSGSMSPTFNAGDFIVSDRFERGEPLVPGDVITFRQGGLLVTHRILEVRGEAPRREFVTQGDANRSPDTHPVAESAVEAVYRFHVPLYGYVTNLAAQREGKLLFVALPAALIFVLQGRQVARKLAAMQGASARTPTAAAAAPAARQAPGALASPAPAGGTPRATPPLLQRPATPLLVPAAQRSVAAPAGPPPACRFEVVRR